MTVSAKQQDITRHEVMREWQGRQVETVLGGRKRLLTLVRLMDPDHPRLILADRRDRMYPLWELTQEMFDRLQPAPRPATHWILPTPPPTPTV